MTVKKPPKANPVAKPTPNERKGGVTKDEVEHSVVYGQQGLGVSKPNAFAGINPLLVETLLCGACGNPKSGVCAVCGN